MQLIHGLTNWYTNLHISSLNLALPQFACYINQSIGENGQWLQVQQASQWRSKICYSFQLHCDNQETNQLISDGE